MRKQRVVRLKLAFAVLSLGCLSALLGACSTEQGDRNTPNATEDDAAPASKSLTIRFDDDGLTLLKKAEQVVVISRDSGAGNSSLSTAWAVSDPAADVRVSWDSEGPFRST
ncbi:MAG: hypothetical protein HQ526_07230 [Actinobacteria bacterium]|nr:hypothetical protein [Actinomycetota bacterium]